ncbi:MAG: DUF4296 domain-containing protein [Chitinophagaceae bacterium]
MRLLFLLVIAISLLSSCGNNNVPSGIIPPDKMQTIIWQMLQADEYVNSVLVHDSTKKSSIERSKHYQEIFDLNKTTKEDFKKSYKFYIDNPDIMKPMFDSLGARATRERTNLYKPKTDSAAASTKSAMERLQLEKKRQDSIAKSNVSKDVIAPKIPDSISRKLLKPIKAHRLRRDSSLLRPKK